MEERGRVLQSKGAQEIKENPEEEAMEVDYQELQSSNENREDFEMETMEDLQTQNKAENPYSNQHLLEVEVQEEEELSPEERKMLEAENEVQNRLKIFGFHIWATGCKFYFRKCTRI